MALNTQFSIAVHLMAGLGCRCGQETTSAMLASSVNTSPSFVRRVLAKLSRAGLVKTCTGKNGSCWLARNAETISLLDIYRAVDAPEVFAIHPYDSKKQCVVSCNIKRALEGVLCKSQQAVEQSLKAIPLAEVISDVNK